MEIKKSGSTRALESGKIAVTSIKLVPSSINGAGQVQSNSEIKDKLIEAFSQQIRVRILGKASNTLSSEGQSERQKQALEIGLQEVLFPEGNSSVTVGSKLLAQVWKICLERSMSGDKGANNGAVLFEGAFELKHDFTKSPQKHPVFFNYEIESFCQSEVYSKKIDGVNTVKYRIPFTCLKNTNHSGQEQLKKQLLQQCMDIAKKIKNANCEAQFYQSQLAKDLVTQNKVDQANPQISTRRISFEAETCAITPFDYLRLFFSVEADQIAQKLNFLFAQTQFIHFRIYQCSEHHTVPKFEILTQTNSSYKIYCSSTEQNLAQQNRRRSSLLFEFLVSKLFQWFLEP